MNPQRPPPPLVHKPSPRGCSRRCMKLELSVVLVHEISRNSITESPVVVHGKKHGGTARTAAPSAVQPRRPINMSEIGSFSFKWNSFATSPQPMQRCGFGQLRLCTLHARSHTKTTLNQLARHRSGFCAARKPLGFHTRSTQNLLKTAVH